MAASIMLLGIERNTRNTEVWSTALYYEGTQVRIGSFVVPHQFYTTKMTIQGLSKRFVIGVYLYTCGSVPPLFFFLVIRTLWL